MNAEQIEAQLRADIQTFDNVTTTADRFAALRAWMVDVSQYVVACANKMDELGQTDDAAAAQFRRLYRELLMRRVLWNPRLLEALTD